MRQTATLSNMFHVHSIYMRDGLVSVIKHLLAFILAQYFFCGGEKLQLLNNLSQWLCSMHMAYGKLHFSPPLGRASKLLNDKILIHINQPCLCDYVPKGSKKYLDCITLYLVQIFSQRQPLSQRAYTQHRQEKEWRRLQHAGRQQISPSKQEVCGTASIPSHWCNDRNIQLSTGLSTLPAIQFSAHSNSLGLKKKKEIPQMTNMVNCYMTHTKEYAVFHKAGMTWQPKSLQTKEETPTQKQ